MTAIGISRAPSSQLTFLICHRQEAAATLERTLCSSIVEIAAELGSAYLAADFAVTDEVSSRHAAYIANHLPIVGIGVDAAYEAAPIAEAAVAFIHAELAEAARRRAERRSA